MSARNKLAQYQGRQPFTPFTIWEEFGITEHLGGIRATQSLIQMCNFVMGQRVLDIGCGTGYTACYLAKKYQAQVVGLDMTASVLEKAGERASRAGVGDKVSVCQADAHELPYPARAFDLVILESVMVFCDTAKAASEIYRVLKPEGMVADNELTLLKPPPEQLQTLLTNVMGVVPLQQEEWQDIFKGVGFINVFSNIFPLSLRDQLVSHLKVDGLRRYMAAVIRGILDPDVRRAFFTSDMLKAARQFIPYIGYGLYVGQKGG